MKITSSLIVVLLSCLTAFAGTLSGDVKTTGQSAVVLETVPAKAFPAPKQTAAMDQRGMQFTPALLVIQQAPRSCSATTIASPTTSSGRIFLGTRSWATTLAPSTRARP